MSVKKLFGIFFASALAVAGMQGCSDKSKSQKVVLSSDCWVDAINDKASSVVETKPGVIFFKGWAADSSTGTVPKEMGIYISDSKGNKVLFKTDKRVLRADVVAAEKQPAYEMSGFDFSVDASGLSAGEHALSLVMFREGERISCLVPKRLLVK